MKKIEKTRVDLSVYSEERMIKNNYKTLDVLYENKNTLIYKAIRTIDDFPVIIKVCKNSEDSYLLKYEYDILKHKRIKGAANVINLVYDENNTYLVMEDTQGIVMDSYFYLREVKEIDFVKIARNAAKALANIHENKIIHRDIKPSNILIDPVTLEVWFIDFGIAVNIEEKEIPKSDGLQGTIEYLSPEQTGRVNLTVDERSDLYSLGVTLYKVLTGRLPFTGNTTMELIHSHIALKPDSPAEMNGVNQTISDIILKLLEKSPEDRYQSAKSLESDLTICCDYLEHGDEIKAFDLGKGDKILDLNIEDILYGKEADMRQLKNYYDNLGSSKTELVVLTGLPGTGKTRLMHEFEQYVLGNNGWFVHGRYELSERNEPYYAIKEAFSRHFEYLKAIGVDLTDIVDILLKRLDGNGRALMSIFPFLEEVFGEQPPLVPLNFTENQKRNEQVFKVLLQTLSSASHPIVVFMDDVHYADYYSLQLFLSALMDKNSSNLMVVLGMRTNEIKNNLQLLKMKDYMDSVDYSYKDIELQYLSLSDVCALLERTFSESSEETKNLSEFVYKTTVGKPFEIATLLRLMVKKDLVHYNAQEHKFQWDLEKIEQLELNLDVESSFSEMIEEISPKTLEILMFLASCGGEFKEVFLEACLNLDLDNDEIRHEINELLDKGIIVNLYQNIYAFEDRLFRLYCYNLQSVEKKEKTHYIIGKNLLERFKDNPKKMEFYGTSITDQLNGAGSIAKMNEDANVLAELNLKSGNFAFEAGDALKALAYYQKGIEVLAPDEFKLNYDLAFQLNLKCSECHLAIGDSERFDKVCKRLITKVKTEENKYKLFSRIMGQYNGLGLYEMTIELGAECLKGIGLLYEEQDDPIIATQKAKELFEKNVEGSSVQALMELPYTTENRVLQIGNIMALMTSAMWSLGDPRGEYYHLRVGNLAYEKGLFEGVEVIYENGALRMMRRKWYKRAEGLINAAIQYSEKHSAPKSTAYVYYGTHIIHWLHPVDEVSELYKKAKKSALIEGRSQMACNADLFMLDARVFNADNIISYVKEVNLAIESAKKAGYQKGVKILEGVYKQAGKCLLGKTMAPNSFDDGVFNEADYLKENESDQRILAYFYSYKLLTLCIHSYFSEAYEVIKKLDQYETPFGGSILVATNNFLSSYTLLQLCDQEPENQEKYLEIVDSNQKVMKLWVEGCRENFLSRYLFIEMEIQRVKHNFDKLMPLYSEVHDLLHTTGEFGYLEGMLQESMAKFWSKIQVNQYMLYHKARAYHIFKNIKFFIKAAQLSGDNNRFISETTDAIGLPSFTTNISSNYEETLPLSNHNLDSETILSIIALLNQDLKMTVLSEKLLSILIQNSGATKGFIVVLTDGIPVIQSVYYTSVSPDDLSTMMIPIMMTEVNESAVPVNAIQYVLSKKVVTIANSVSERYMFFNDDYFRAQNPESFACIPITIKENAIGAIYLENTGLPGVFTPERVNIINTITMQSSVIFQNAIYYNEISNYAKTVEIRLKEHTNLLNSLIAGIAHEINTPVGVCVTVISRMEELTKEVLEKFQTMKLSKTALKEYLEESEKGLTIAEANITRAVELIQNFKKVSVDQSNEVFEELNLYQTLKNIVEYVRPAIKKKVTNISIIGDQELLMTTCSGSLVQIFTNLIMNSVVHGFEDMEINKCKITIEFREDKNKVQVIYSDNGKGMSEEQLERLFQPFYTTKRNRGGSGLGAHIILSLVTQTLNGTVNCVSTVGKGSSFIIHLPKAQSNSVKKPE